MSRFAVVSSVVVAALILVVASLNNNNNNIFVNAQLSSAKAVLAEREASLARFVTRLETLEARRCSQLTSYSSSSNDCNVAACGNKFPSEFGFSCNKNYGSDSNTCDCDGLIRSVNKSNVLFSQNPDFSNKDIQSFLAVTELNTKGATATDQDWTAQARYERDHQNMVAWAGVGSSSGASRWFPGSPRGRGSSCSPYDPRIRSWYVAASAGPKDVVIVVDTSGSMATKDCSVCSSRLSLMQDAVKSLLDTFTFNDYFSIVQFNSVGSTVTSGTGLKQASITNVNDAKNRVGQLFANGGTNFQSGFAKAFDVLAATSEGTSNCQRIILFLTDGIADDGSTIASYISGRQTSLGSRTAAIFTFSMSSGADDTRPREIACANTGVWAKINNGVNPLDAMSQYYKFLAGGVNTTKPRWVEPYVDAFGLGRMTTTSLPFYNKDTSTPIFQGVAEIDVPLAELTKFVSETQLVAELTSRGSACPVYNVTHCYLQLLRNAAGYECPSGQTLAQCRSSSSLDEVAACSTGITGGVNTMLCDGLRTNTLVSTSGPSAYADVVCCDCGGLSVGAIAGISVGAVAGVVIIGIIIYSLSSGGAAAASGGGATVAATGASANVAPVQPQPIQAQPSGFYGQQQPDPNQQGGQLQYTGSVVLQPNQPNVAGANPYGGSSV